MVLAEAGVGGCGLGVVVEIPGLYSTLTAVESAWCYLR